MKKQKEYLTLFSERTCNQLAESTTQVNESIKSKMLHNAEKNGVQADVKFISSLNPNNFQSIDEFVNFISDKISFEIEDELILECLEVFELERLINQNEYIISSLSEFGEEVELEKDPYISKVLSEIEEDLIYRQTSILYSLKVYLKGEVELAEKYKEFGIITSNPPESFKNLEEYVSTMRGFLSVPIDDDLVEDLIKSEIIILLDQKIEEDF